MSKYEGPDRNLTGMLVGTSARLWWLCLSDLGQYIVVRDPNQPDQKPRFYARCRIHATKPYKEEE